MPAKRKTEKTEDILSASDAPMLPLSGVESPDLPETEPEHAAPLTNPSIEEKEEHLPGAEEQAGAPGQSGGRTSGPADAETSEAGEETAAEPQTEPEPQPEPKPKRSRKTAAKREPETDPGRRTAAEAESLLEGVYAGETDWKTDAASSAPQWVRSILSADRTARLESARSDPDLAGTWAQVLSQARRGSVIPSVITSAETIQGKDRSGKPVLVCVAACRINGFTAYIPLAELWVYPPSGIKRRPSEDQDAYLARTRTFITNMLGAPVSVVITSCSYDEHSETSPYKILASRRRASLATIEGFYHPDPARSVTKVGDVCRATVISVGRDGLYAELRGMETYIPMHRLTYRYLTAIRDAYRPGDTLMAEVTSIRWGSDKEVHTVASYKNIKRLLDGGCIAESARHRVEQELAKDRVYICPDSISLSCRREEARALYAKNHSRVRPRGRYRAIVSSIWQPPGSGRPYIRLFLPDVELVANATGVRYGGIVTAPAVGDYVEFTFSGESQQEPYILYGAITRKL